MSPNIVPRPLLLLSDESVVAWLGDSAVPFLTAVSALVRETA